MVDSGKLDMREVSVSGNAAVSGGGLYFCTREWCELRGCQINRNKATGSGHDGHGGGIYNEGVRDSGDMLGQVALYDTQVAYNTATQDGGGIYSWNDSDAYWVSGGSFEYNECGRDGGGANIFGGNNANFYDVTFVGNKAKGSGGGLFAEVYKFTGYDQPRVVVQGCRFEKNTAGGYGGAIRIEDGPLYLTSGTITNNSAALGGSGIHTNPKEDKATLNIASRPVVQGNVGGVNVYVNTKEKLYVFDDLRNGASVGVTIGDTWGVFTKGYSEHNSEDPATYFTSDDGYEVYLKDGEAALRRKESDANAFIDVNSQVVRDTGSLNGRNWMGGISGERRLNEINVPCTHDAAMADPDWKFATTAVITGGLASNSAKTQDHYIDELLNDGVRYMDLRLKNTVEEWDFSYIVPKPGSRDDGENLWLCHGKTMAGTFYATDHDGDWLTLDDVLTYVKTFLAQHPTETVMLEMNAETSSDYAHQIVFQRLRKILRELQGEINPATNESYLYTENDYIYAPYSDYPQLKDCRGKIVIAAGADDVAAIGGLTWTASGKVRYRAGDNKMDLDTMATTIESFYSERSNLGVPRDAESLYPNLILGAGSNNSDPLAGEPIKFAHKINARLFQEGGVFDHIGQYFGYVSMDGVTEKEARGIWITNFPDDISYCTVTASSGLDPNDYPNPADYQDKTYSVLTNTPITIPDSIYGSKNAQGETFIGWEANGKLYHPGEPFTITGDVTFTAKWTKEALTPIQVVWDDGYDADVLRPDALTVRLNNSQEITVREAGGWSYVAEGAFTSATPVWSRISSDKDHPQGQDTTGQYRYETKLTDSKELVIALYHTPASFEGWLDISGTINWDDEDNVDGLRPDSVTLHLLANGVERGKTTVNELSNWGWTFGELPTYASGRKITYTITQDDIEGYTNSVVGFDVTNTHMPNTTNIIGMVAWDDENDSAGKRPDSVTLHLLANGEEVASQEVGEGELRDWSWSFDVTQLERENTSGKEIEYSITQDPIEMYDTSVDIDGGFYVVRNESYATHWHNLSPVAGKEPTCTEPGIRDYLVCNGGKHPCGKYFSDFTGLTELSAEDLTLPALGHDWGEWEVTKGRRIPRMARRPAPARGTSRTSRRAPYPR